MVLPLESDLDRPIEHRVTARVLLLRADGRVLLLEDSDPAAPGVPTFWITPGGGVEAGESPADAAARELDEETGIVLRAEAFRGPIAQRRVVHGYGDKIAVQTETFFLATTDRGEIRPTGLTEDEQLTLVGHRWWSLAELQATDERIWPADLTALVEAATVPSRWPLTLGTAEESTVPAGPVADHV